MIDKVFSALVQLANAQELDILSCREIAQKDVTHYQTMLNRHFPPKSVFIFDADLELQIRDAYLKESNPFAKQALFNEIHKRTNGVLLCYYSWILFTIYSKFSGRFNFVEVDLQDEEIKGKRLDVDFFKTFFQDYLFSIKSQRKTNHIRPS